MNSSQVFRNCYINLYTQLRKYLWDFDTVNIIADLEIAAYKSFPEVPAVKSLLNKLRRQIFTTLCDDKELGKALDDFDVAVQDNPEVALFIKKFKEVNPT